MRSAGYHQANVMASTIDEFRTELIESVRQVQDNVITAVQSPPSLLDENNFSPQTQTANAVVSNSDLSGLVTMMSSLANTVQNIQNNMNNGATDHGSHGGRGGGRGNQGGRRQNRQRGNQFGRHPRWHRSDTSKYCWTHGACSHNSADCANPLPGHKNNATFQNRLNGCDHYCSQDNNNSNENVTNYTTSICNNVYSSSDVVIAKGDSAATNNYWKKEDENFLFSPSPFVGPSVTLPDGTTIRSTTMGYLPLSNQLSSKAKKATVLPNLKSSSLISLGQIADDDCTILLDQKNCQ